MKKILVVYKGGPGSGMHREEGHRGIPGQQGGSLPRNAGAKAVISKLQLREGWEGIRKKLTIKLAHIKPYFRPGIGMDTAHFQAWIDYTKNTTELLNNLSQDELYDVITHFNSPEGKLEIDTEYEARKAYYKWQIKITNDTGIPLISEPFEMELAICRMDLEHSQKLLDATMNTLETIDKRAFASYDFNKMINDYRVAGANFMAGGDLWSKDYAIWRTAHPQFPQPGESENAATKELRDLREIKNNAADLIEHLYQYGPTNEFRHTAQSRLDELSIKIKGMPNEAYDATTKVSYHLSNSKYRTNAIISTGDYLIDKTGIIESWTMDSTATGNPWVHMLALKAFGNIDSQECYWTAYWQGMIYRDPDPVLVKTLKSIYQETQDYYKSPEHRAPKTFYRAVATKVTVQSPLSATSSGTGSIKHFGENTMTYKGIPVESILMSYKSMEGIWTPEKEIKGKKEYVLLADFLVPGGTK